MPPRRGRGRSTATSTRKQPAEPSEPKNTKRVARKPANNTSQVDEHVQHVAKGDLPLEIWHIILELACSYPDEMDYSPSSYRAWAALGLPANPADVERRAKERSIAFQTRRNIQLVSKKWNKMGKEFFYHTIFVNERTRHSLTYLLASALVSSEETFLNHVKRFELDFDITKYTIEGIGPLVRVIAQSCPKLEIVDDTIRRTGYERAVSPLKMDVQASFELPFSLAIGNKKYMTIQHARFSRDSCAAFTLHYNLNLLQRFPNLHILSLNDLPAWEQIPYDRTPPPPRRRRNFWDREEEEPEEEEVQADDEAEPPQPLTFLKLHTFDISRLKTRSPKACAAMSTYLNGWTVPSVTQLGISIYNDEAIPQKLFQQFSSQLTTLYLHNLKMAKEPKKIIDLPTLKHLVVICPVTDKWNQVFSCTSVTKYTMVWDATTFSYSCRPQPVDWDKERDFSKNWFSKWNQTKTHMELCRDRVLLPNLEEIHIADCLFQSDQWKGDEIKFWAQWHRVMEKRGVRMTAAEGCTWPEARARLPPQPAPTTTESVEAGATAESEDAPVALPVSPKPAKATKSKKSGSEKKKKTTKVAATVPEAEKPVESQGQPQETGPVAAETAPTSAAPAPAPGSAPVPEPATTTVPIPSPSKAAKSTKAAKAAASTVLTPAITIAAATAPTPETSEAVQPADVPVAADPQINGKHR